MTFLRPYIDYPIVALVLLFTVSIFAVTLDILPVIFSSLLSALLLNYFFIPPLHTFHIDSSNDILLFLIFFVVSIVNAILTNKIRKAQADARDKTEKERTIELYNTILNSLSHELRTPIATITASVDTLSYTPNHLNKEQQSTLLNQIQIASTRLNEQIENLLNMSRLDSGILQLKTNWCDINEIVLNTINQFVDTTNKHIHFQEKTIFPLVLIDDGLLSQILNNLISNAIKHTYDKAEITIIVNFANENILNIQIMDTGIGLPESELPKLFDKFYRVPNSVKGGIGLGLSIVKGYVSALQGTISVKQNIPHGLCFEIKVPVEVSYINKLKNE
ncbi:MAG: PAS domain-containing sensor histidine kinase [Saprospiraceae bacterium]|jgi:two-component system sensor histidine kinase KdpD|nr:PAS domain-containing sensor histidine kinase [Saprospiraceae bacterium]